MCRVRNPFPHLAIRRRMPCLRFAGRGGGAGRRVSMLPWAADQNSPSLYLQRGV
jgi:hypothetical protein